VVNRPTRACVVVDLDDTLFLERDYVRSGFSAVSAWLAAERGVQGFGKAAWALFGAGERGTIFDHALVQCGQVASPGLISELVARYRAHRPDIDLLPDARDSLRELQAGPTRLAVVSDGPLESQRAKAKAVGAYEWADPVVLTAELGPGLTKPSPEPFRLVEDATGRTGAECTYVADNPAKDFAGPRARGWRTVRVRRVGSLHEAVPSGDEVDVEIPDLTDLGGILGAAEHGTSTP
jgi:putative hydrolase of the HAD superfamily